MRYTKIFIVTMYIIVKSWIQPKFPQTKWNVLYSYYEIVKDNENESSRIILINII